jgi:NAD(P)H-dependent flavin oxidoreductase YrpB (nitropropane dioxygenase family)
MLKLHTVLCDMLRIQYPVLQAGMGAVAMGELVAAVSDAGGFGVLGAAGLMPDEIRDEIRKIRELTDKPFGADLLMPEDLVHMTDEAKAYITQIPPDRMESLGVYKIMLKPNAVQEQVDVLIEEKVDAIVSGLGNPGWMVQRAHEAGIRVGAVTGNESDAVKTSESGIDYVVACGHEAGGHTGRIGTMALIPQVVDAVKIPVLAAGGIGDGRGLVAALALGAIGVWVGTRFIPTYEAWGHENYKNRILEISDRDTVVSKAYSGKTLRVIRNKYTDEWAKRENEILPFPLQILNIEGNEAIGGMKYGDVEYGCMPAGQISGLIKEMRSAGDVLKEMVEQAEGIINA